MPKPPTPEQPTHEVLHHQGHGQNTFLAEHHFALNLDDRLFDEHPTRYRVRHGAPVSICTHPETGAAREVWVDLHAGTLPSLSKNYGEHFSSHEPPLHRLDGPAVIERDRTGDLTEHWYRRGEPYHPSAHERMKWEATKQARGGPFHDETLESFAGGKPLMGATRELWTTAGFRLNRENAPAITERDPTTGRIVWVRWCERDERHRTDGPAEQRFDPQTGVPVYEAHWRRGRLHNIHGPAEIERDAFGNTLWEEWRKNGSLFRQNGPAYIIRDRKNPSVVEGHGDTWFLNGRSLTEPTPKALGVWQAMVQQQGGLFTQSADQVPQTGPRPAGVKAAAAAAKAKATALKPKARTGDER